jgi:hypothetical protein
MVRLYIPPLPQPTASTLVVVDLFCPVQQAATHASTAMPSNRDLPPSLGRNSRHSSYSNISTTGMPVVGDPFSHRNGQAASNIDAQMQTQARQRRHARPLIRAGRLACWLAGSLAWPGMIQPRIECPYQRIHSTCVHML